MSTETSAVQETPNTAKVDTSSSASGTLVTAPLTSEAPAGASTTTESLSTAEVKYDLKLDEAAILDKSRIGEIEAYAKANKLTNEQAQNLLNMENDVVTKFQQSQFDELEASREKWRQEVIADKELGGNNFNKNIEYAHRALKKFGSEALIGQLEESGLGNHPELVRLFSNIGKSMAEDEIIRTGAMPAAKKSYEEIFYGEKK